MLHQVVDGDFRVVDDRDARVDRLGQVVRRDVGRHADRDAGRAVDQQVGQPRRQDGRFLFLAVVVRDEIDRFLVDVGRQLVGDPLEPALGVAHRRGVVAVDRAEVALAVDQRVTQRKRLRHADQRVVNRSVAVRVVLAHDLADHPRALHVRPVPGDVGLVHRVQDAAMDRLQAVADVRQRATDDDAHRVVEIAVPHLGFEADRQGFFGELLHEGAFSGSVGRNGGSAARWPGNTAGSRGFSVRPVVPAAVWRPPRPSQIVRRPLITRNFITALYCRDSRIASCRQGLLFFAARKPVCYIRPGDIAFDARAAFAWRPKPLVLKNLFKTKAKGVKQ